MERRKFFTGAIVASTAGLVATIPNKTFAHTSGVFDYPSGFINVVDDSYGADPTGISSSSTAFSLAIADAISDDKPLWIPSGTYDLTDLSAAFATGDLVIVGAGSELVTIEGPSSKAFIAPNADSSLRITGLAATGFRQIVHYDTDDLSSIEISNCDFTNLGRQVVGRLGTSASIGNIQRFIFDNNRVTSIGLNNNITDSAAVFLVSDKCNYARVSNNIIDTIGESSNTVNRAFGIYIKAATPTNDSDVKIIISGNKIQNVQNGGVGDCEGVMILGGQAIIKDNHIENIISSDTDTADNEGIYTKCRNSIISGNTLINCGGKEAVIICKGRNRTESAGTSAFGYDNIISNNTIRQDTGMGFRTSGIYTTMDGCIIEGNHISGTQYGIAVNSSIGVRNTIIKGNLIYGLLDYDSNSAILGISVNNPHDLSILDNQITNCGVAESSNVACYGIQITTTSTGSFSGCHIRGNWIAMLNQITASASRGIAINLVTTSTLEKLIVESNHIDSVGRGIHVNNINQATVSSAINNTVSNHELSDIYPTSGSWSLFSNNLV